MSALAFVRASVRATEFAPSKLAEGLRAFKAGAACAKLFAARRAS